MKAETVLDSVVFQLTPTRTRYDLVIIANGKTEKIASGLLDPFLAHLKTAKDQIVKGGYSIRLEPIPGTDTTWFTKDTVERFVQYVSTPEVLERVNTLELEILQINEAIAIQRNGGLCSSIVEDHQSRRAGSRKGGKSVYAGDKETTTVLSKDGKHQRLSTGSIAHEENSRHQLLKVHETRRAVLRKEQRMAFARAVAASFDMDHMANLILFAKSFGASRLLEACIRFVGLWKARHKNWQWLEVTGAEGMPFQSEFASGIIFSGHDWKKNQFNETLPFSGDHLATESYEDSHATASNTEEKMRSSDPQYCHGQIQNPMLSQWVSQLPVSQSYPVQAMSYFHNYPASASAFQSPYPPIDDPGLTIKTGFKSHSMDKVYNSELKTRVMDFSNIGSKDGVDQNDMGLEKRTSHSQKSHKKAGHAGKRQSSAVVVKKHSTSEQSDESKSESKSSLDAESGEEIQDFRSDALSRKHRKSSTTVCMDGVSMLMKTSNIVHKDQVVDGQEGYAGNWQMFQKLLLRVERESTSTGDRDMFSGEDSQSMRRLNKSQADPSMPPSRNNADAQELRMVRGNNESGQSGYFRVKNDDFRISEPMKQVSSEGSSRILSQNEYQNVSNFHKNSLYNESDESFIVPFRSRLHEEAAEGHKTAMDMNSDFRSTHKNNEYFHRLKNQQSYEPHDLNLMPQRGLEERSRAFDLTKEFAMQIRVQNGIKRETRSQEDVSKRSREGLNGSGKERKSSLAQPGLEKRKNDPLTMKGKSSKLNPLADAKARAEKLRAFKADLQKAKKEKEEEERKRLEALKRERQKRIAARSSLNTARSPLDALLTKPRKPTGNSPSSCNGSKSSDTKPISKSPIRKIPSSKSPWKSHQIPASVTPKPSPYSNKGSKFSDAQPDTTSPLLKLLRSSKNVAQSTCKPQHMTVQKQTRLSPSSAPAKLPISSKLFAQSTSKSPETAAQKPTRLYSSVGRGSKFSDTAPSSSSPIQKLRTRTMSASSLDSHKITKVNRFSGSTNLVRSGSGQSASPILGLKEETNGLSLGANAVHIQAKRLSDPKGSGMHSASSVRSATSDQLQKKTMPEESHAKSKPATLQSRIVASREPCGEVNKNASMKETRNETRGKTSLTSESMLDIKANELALALRNKDDDQIVEKAILIFENKTISAPVIRTPEQIGNIRVGSCEVSRTKRVELITEHPAVQLPATPLSADEVNNSSHCKPHMQSISYEVGNPPKATWQKLSYPPITEKPDNAPFTRALQVQGSTSSEIEDIEEHVDQKISMVGSGRATRACHSVDSIYVEQIHEVHEKPHTRGSPKGFKELLKFRQKGQSLASNELSAETSAVNVCSLTTTSNNVSTLKDLFSKDDNAKHTSTKVSRSFPLFSPFQIKSSKKKP